MGRYGVTVVQKPLPLLEIQSLKIEEVSESKASQAETMTRDPFVIEDSAMYIPAIGNFPGTLLKPVFQALGEETFLKLLEGSEDRTALVVGQLIYVNPVTHERKVFQGTYDGKISTEVRGENSRGWQVSRIFIPRNSEKTLAEMDDTEWDAFLEDYRRDDHYEKLGQWLQKADNTA